MAAATRRVDRVAVPPLVLCRLRLTASPGLPPSVRRAPLSSAHPPDGPRPPGCWRPRRRAASDDRGRSV